MLHQTSTRNACICFTGFRPSLRSPRRLHSSRALQHPGHIAQGHQPATRAPVVNMGYQHTTSGIMAALDPNSLSLSRSLCSADAEVTDKRKSIRLEVERATRRINHLSERLSARRNPESAPSSVLLTEPFVFADGPNEFTRDCALIELYRDKIRLEEHVHGKQGLLYIGTFPIFFLSSLACYRPEVSVKADYYIPRSGPVATSRRPTLASLCSVPAARARSRQAMTTQMMGSSRAYDVVQYNGIRRPQHLDIHSAEALLEVKNGLITGTIVHRATGLDSFTRTHTKYNIKHTSTGVAILRYDKQRAPSSPFPESGDSGSIVQMSVVRLPAKGKPLAD